MLDVFPTLHAIITQNTFVSAYFSTTAKSWVKPSKDSLHYFVSNFPLFWKVVNRIDWFRRFLMKIILKGDCFNGAHDCLVRE